MGTRRGRRGNGEGTIHYNKKRRCYEGKLPAQRGPDGRVTRPSFSTRTREEAVAKLREAAQLSDRGMSNDAYTVTLGQQIDHYLRQVDPTLRPSTRRTYRYSLAHANGLREVPLARLDRRTISNEFDRLRALGRSESTLARLHGNLFSVLKEAVADSIVASNVMTTVRRPKVRKAVTRVWTRDEVLTFIASIPVNHPDYAFFYTLIFTGLRRGELLGLRWSDYYLLEDGFGVLSVRQTVVPSEGAGSEFSTPKSEKGVRDIIITPDVVTALDRHATVVAEAAAKAGSVWKGEPAIFPSEVGTYRDPRNASRAFKRWVRLAGVPRIRLHDARHTHASLLAAAGIDIGLISNRLGHAGIAITNDTYRHLYGPQRKAAAYGMDALRETTLARHDLPGTPSCRFGTNDH